MNVYIARQPIFDAEYNVVAYELLYRESLENVFTGEIADDVATSLLLINSYFNFGIEQITSGTKAFINFDKSLIIHGIPELLDKERVTIEVLETIEPDRIFLKKLRSLQSKGYCVALDDYTIDYPYQSILDVCELIKVDFKDSKREDLISVIKAFRAAGKKLLAEKVETKEEFEWAKAHGFDLFQGFYFAKPSVETRKSMDDSTLNYLKLMDELNKEEPNFKALAKIIVTDVSLTYKLLKLANSSIKPVSEITSIQQAITVLGVNHFKRWLTLAMMDGHTKPETNEVFKYALIRSNLLIKIAQASNLAKHEEELALLGTLSVLDVILEMEMTTVLESLPISQEMKDTLLGENTKFSDAMRLCFAYEKGIFQDVEEAAVRLGYELEKLPEHYVAAISYAEKAFRALKE